MALLLNEAFGWFWLTLGMTAGAFMGLRFRDENWLGGYASWPRRMIRLGHVAMIMLGAVNILFAYSGPRVHLGAPLPLITSIFWIVGAVLMPLCCLAAAADARRTALFPIPVLALLIAGTLTWLGLLMGLLSGAYTP